jgi:DNA polymerase I
MMYLGLDAPNWIVQLWHATHGKDTLKLAVRRVQSLLSFAKPRVAVACFDSRSFRYDIYPEYKSNRKEKDPELQRVIDEGPEAFASVVQVAFQDGYEADDLLATLAHLGVKRGRRVILASGDKDLRQCLVEGKVTQLRSFDTAYNGFCNPVWYTAKTLLDETGLRPEQWADYQALCGDSGDGVPGCEGWGPKTTLAAMAAYPSLHEILAHIGELPVSDRLRAKLALFSPQADLMLRLVTLKTDAAIVEGIQ